MNLMIQGFLESRRQKAESKGALLILHQQINKDSLPLEIEEIINIQPQSNNKAKPYQVKQVRNLILKYKLSPSRP